MNKQDHNGKTALHMAASANKAEAVKLLVDVANVDIIPDRYENRLKNIKSSYFIIRC